MCPSSSQDCLRRVPLFLLTDEPVYVEWWSSVLVQLAHRRYPCPTSNTTNARINHRTRPANFRVEKYRVPGKPSRMKTKAEHLVSTDIVTFRVSARLAIQESMCGTQLSTSRQHQPPTQSSTLVTRTCFRQLVEFQVPSPLPPGETKWMTKAVMARIDSRRVPVRARVQGPTAMNRVCCEVSGSRPEDFPYNTVARRCHCARHDRARCSVQSCCLLCVTSPSWLSPPRSESP